jgi:hypothetical protein
MSPVGGTAMDAGEAGRGDAGTPDAGSGIRALETESWKLKAES